MALWVLDPLPSRLSVSKIIATDYYGPDHKQVTFEVPLEKWPAIKWAMLVPWPDPEPAKWSIIGTLKVRTRTGSIRFIHLFYIGEGEPGAFSIGTETDMGDYYRGGDSDQLYEAMRDAYNLAKQRGLVQKAIP